MRYLTMSRLGRMGRFGNQLFQYAFLRCYADDHGLNLMLPDWVGKDLFGFSEPPCDRVLRPVSERTDDKKYPLPPEGDEWADCDWSGYAQYPGWWWRQHRKKVRSMFEWPRGDLPTSARCVELVKAYHKLMYSATIGLHIRRGDYGTSGFPLTPLRWYIQWLREHWSEFNNPLLVIATEDRGVVEAFAEYKPQTAESLGITLSAEAMPHYNYLDEDRAAPTAHTMDFFADWLLLSLCKVMVLSNSTFGWTAAMMGLARPFQVWRADCDCAGFRRVNPWYDRPLLHQKTEDYPHLKGIRQGEPEVDE